MRVSQGVRRQFVTIVASAALVVGMAAAPANAYATFGCRWVSNNVSVLSYPPAGYTIVNSNAKNDWSNNTDVNFFTGSAADVSINYNNQGLTGWSGIASGSSGCSGGYYSTTIPIVINRYYTDGYTSSQRQSVITHELGHSIGLAHVGTASTACSSVTIMNPTDSRRFTCSRYSTVADDRNGANAIY